MDKLNLILLFSILLTSLPFADVSVLTNDQEAQLETIFQILQYIYEDNLSAIPSDANDIAALETSTESRDQLAFALFGMIDAIRNGELDLTADMEADSVIAIEEPSVISEESISSFAAEVNMGNELFLAPDLALGFETTSMFTMESVEELSGPLDSCIIPGGTYLITSLPLQIEGHVVICAGATLIAPFDPNNPVIEVMPGGLLETGKAAYYDSGDDPNILSSVKIVPEDPNIIYNHNTVGIYIHRGTDPKTRIENVIVENCTAGIVIDEALEYPIRNVITYGCYDGIQVYAPARIMDCQFWNNGSVWIGPFGYAGTGIYVSLDWDEDEPEVAIDRTTIYFADVALYIEGGSTDPNNNEPNQVVPTVTVINSALTGGMYYGLYQSPGEASIDVQYCAFGGNYDTSNIGLPFTGCVDVYSNPFYNREEDWEKLYVLPWSELIDAGYGMATDGTGVSPDRPDMGLMDIGCHFPLGISGGFGIPSSPADFNGDGIVDELDLGLINACLGATDDPNLLRMDFNYDSWINMPDYAFLAYDYGYCGDPNICTNSDPNCARSDFDGDDDVDMADLAILCEFWLTPVFDDYRVCSLCNLHTGIDPNDPNGLSGDHIIDQRDMDIFMADWGKTTQFECSVSFTSADGNSLEPNQLSDIVKINIEESPSSTWTFIQVDGMPVEQRYADGGMPSPFMLPTYAFANGSHMLTLGGYTSEDGCWIQKFPMVFDNQLYFASISDTYEPNELYEITGFFDDGTVEISTDPNASTTSDTGYIEHASIISTPTAEATLTFNNGVSIETQTVSLLAAVDMSKKDPNSYRALIIAPFDNANDDFEATLEAIRTALSNKGISYMELIEKNANWNNISIALRGNNLNYVYWIGHTNSRIGEKRNLVFEVIEGEEGVSRTNFKCWEKRRFWPDSSEGRIFSCLSSDGITQPSVPEALPDDWETSGHSMWSLRLWETKTIKEFWAIGCETGLEWQNAGNTYSTINDMASAVGAYYTDQQGNYVHVYMGNRTPVWFGGLLDQSLSYPNAIAHIIQRHTNHDLEDALINGPQNSNERKAVWGIDLDRDGLTDNVLQWWPKNSKLDWIYFN